MDRERMEAYYRAFNSGDHKSLAEYYSEDIVFEYRDVTLKGREVVLRHFEELQRGFSETIRPKNILVDGGRVAVEVEDTFTAKVDLPDFLGRSLKKGDFLTARYGCFYDTRDNEICHVRLYSFS